jgi:serine/threonine-protein kinase
MAEIFLAIQHGAEGFEKPIVLKRILTAYSADPQFRNMMLDEAHISMSLQHSNIAQVLDLGVAGGRYFLALELVDGWDLERILQRAYAAGIVWPNALSLYVIACVCRALAYAHVKSRDGKPLGIVHRDISPNNVLISDQAEVKLTDFGVAKAQRKREQTAAGVIKGKVAYMSPEQALGTTVDKRSDIFSVGSMFYRMVTEKLPFDAGDDMEQLLRVQRAEFTPPEQVKPTVGPGVAGIIMRALRLAPSERYQSADEMLVDVERVLRTEYQSAGQTELKLWMAQLARRDGSQSFGKTRPGTMATIADGGGTDISVGSSFELVDFDEAVVSTSDVAFAPGAVVSGGPASKGPPPIPQGTPQGLAPIAPEMAPPPRDTAAMRAIEQKSRGLRGFWFGAMFALAAVIGARYAIEWARTQPFLGRILGNPPAPAAPPTVVVAPAPAKPGRATADGKSGSAKAAKPESMKGEPAKPAVVAAVPDAGAAKAPEIAAAAPARKPDAGSAVAAGESAEPDEEALLRQALPNAENAVIGEEEADGPVPEPKGTASKGSKTAARMATASRAAATSAKPETVSLHITSTPVGAVVRTKYKVLGRTPISLHFRGGNTYELMFIKQGYAQATKRVTIAGTGAKDRKVAVVLKKNRTPVGRQSVFHIHR